ncbi:hypothetical protein RMN57_12945 [Kitasatospora sp. CM 4170]|uniref:DNA-binding protein n=1 Tax=Kitasatospora aburaviensis TaxID=67265 RepID=A0ABW1F5G5_9ACTN|nr:hypothetical protein [Kitasatospora sp. CM 4170]WNM45561.1 hypothetical protein RMN57_12945 [Kitasatospora sp. CM 4170]
MTTKKVATTTLPEWLTATDRLRLYSPEEVIALGLLPHTIGTLKDAAYRKRVPHTKVAGKIRFRLDHIYEIQQAGESNPATRGRRAA